MDTSDQRFHKYRDEERIRIWPVARCLLGRDQYIGSSSTGQTTASADGTFTFTNVALTLGTNSFKAKARDSANNVSSFSNKKTVVYLPAGESLIEILSPADGSTVYK